MKILLVTENMSQKMGGESMESLIFFRLFRKRNIDVHVISHARVESEMRELLSSEEFEKITFVRDTKLQAEIWEMGKKLPSRFRDLIIGQAIHFLTQYQVRQIALRKLEEDSSFDLIFEPVPITPKGISFMYDMGVPVVIGPLSGGLSFPPEFQFMDTLIDRLGIKFGRLFSTIANHLVPGKIKADTLMVANPKTKEALPLGYRGKVYQVFESGVDLSLWESRTSSSELEKEKDRKVRFIFSGRFVDWKGGEYLLQAFSEVATRTNSILAMVGDGELRQDWEVLAKDLGIQDKVFFHGWLTREQCASLLRESDVFVMPSLREAGGNAILEAMALGLPVVATNWCGPAYILDETCGFLVDPTSVEDFINGLTNSMVQLAQSSELRLSMGKASMEKIHTNYFDWDSKVDKIIEIFTETLSTINPT